VLTRRDKIEAKFALRCLQAVMKADFTSCSIAERLQVGEKIRGSLTIPGYHFLIGLEEMDAIESMNQEGGSNGERSTESASHGEKQSRDESE